MSQPYETSEAIVAGIGKGDSKAETAMIEKYSRALLFVLEKRTGDREMAKDLHQEAFLIVLQKLRKEPIADPSKLAAYLHRTAINLHIGSQRKSIRQKTSVDSETISRLADAQDTQLKDLVKERARFAVRKLVNELDNDRDRKILISYYMQENDKSEVCKQLDLTTRHFDRVISRARKRFKQLLEDQDVELQMELTS